MLGFGRININSLNSVIGTVLTQDFPTGGKKFHVTVDMANPGENLILVISLQSKEYPVSVAIHASLAPPARSTEVIWKDIICYEFKDESDNLRINTNRNLSTLKCIYNKENSFSICLQFKKPVQNNKLNPKKAEEVPFVGLKNQGCTCFLNSVLQMLFHIPEFRKQIYSIPTNNSNVKNVEAIAAIQRLFCCLELKKTNLSTLQMTKSLPQNPFNSGYFSIQEDAHQFMCDFLDTISKYVTEASQNNFIDDLFMSELEITHKDENGDVIQTHSDKILDFQLNVKGIPNIQQSFVDYFMPEQIEMSDKCITLEKSIKKIAPVLHIILKRFDQRTFTKINDSLEFPAEINLNQYVNDKSIPTNYILFGLVAHKGNLNVGHYVSFIRPTKSQHWYQFDDDKVYNSSCQHAITENYGQYRMSSNIPARSKSDLPGNPYIQHYNAYILSYIRSDLVDQLYQSFDISIIPEIILEASKNVQADFQQIMYPINVITENNISLMVEEGKRTILEGKQPSTIVVSPNETNENIYKEIQLLRGAKSIDSFRIWRCDSEHKPMTPMPITGQDINCFTQQHTIFVESITKNDPIEITDKFIVFVTFFDFSNTKKRFRYIDKLLVSNEMPISVCFKKLEVSTPQDLLNQNYSNYQCYVDDRKPEMPRCIDSSKTFGENQINHGAILYFQINRDDIHSSNSKKHCRSHSKRKYIENYCEKMAPYTVDRFFSILFDFRVIHLYSFQSTISELFSIKLPATFEIVELRKLLSKIRDIKWNPQTDSFILYETDDKHNPVTTSTQDINDKSTIRELNHKDNQIHLFYHYIRGVPSSEFMERATIRLFYQTDKGKRIFNHCPNKNSTLYDALLYLQNNGFINIDECSVFRIDPNYQEKDTPIDRNDYQLIPIDGKVSLVRIIQNRDL